MFSTTTNSIMQLFKIARKIEGRIKLQKVIFILQEKNLIDFELCYKYALYGPYSEELQIEIEYLTRIGFLKESLTEEGYAYELNESFPIKIQANSDIELNRSLIEKLLDKESQLLEVTSTIYYLKSHKYKDEAIPNKIKLLKPNLHDRINNAFELYSSLENSN